MAHSGRALGFLIHVLTASGAAFALLALIAAHDRLWPAMFAWLGCALIVDAIDGPLARRVNLRELLPRWSGEVLDLVVDFTTYVFVPAYAIFASGLIDAPFSVLAGVIVAVAGALYFADRQMKTADNYFRGFPGLWNVVAFYLLLLRPAPWLAGALIVVLAVASFVPFPFIHPVRVARFRAFNIAVLALWSVFAVVALASAMEPPAWVTAVLCAIALYILGAGVFRRSG